MHRDKSASNLEIQIFKSNMKNFMCPFIVMMLTCHIQHILDDSY
jgi:hypothetical protein